MPKERVDGRAGCRRGLVDTGNRRNLAQWVGSDD